MEPVRVGRESRTARCNGVGVLVDRDDLRTMLEKHFGVAAASGCAVQENEPRGRAQERRHLLGHYRDMVGLVRLFQGLERQVVEVPRVHKRCGGEF